MQVQIADTNNRKVTMKRKQLFEPKKHQPAVNPDTGEVLRPGRLAAKIRRYLASPGIRTAPRGFKSGMTGKESQ